MPVHHQLCPQTAMMRMAAPQQATSSRIPWKMRGQPPRQKMRDAESMAQQAHPERARGLLKRKLPQPGGIQSGGQVRCMRSREGAQRHRACWTVWKPIQALPLLCGLQAGLSPAEPASLLLKGDAPFCLHAVCRVQTRSGIWQVVHSCKGTGGRAGRHLSYSWCKLATNMPLFYLKQR